MNLLELFVTSTISGKSMAQAGINLALRVHLSSPPDSEHITFEHHGI